MSLCLLSVSQTGAGVSRDGRLSSSSRRTTNSRELAKKLVLAFAASVLADLGGAREVVPETTFDGTLIDDISLETLASEDLSATRLTAMSAGNPRVGGT